MPKVIHSFVSREEKVFHYVLLYFTSSGVRCVVTAAGEGPFGPGAEPRPPQTMAGKSWDFHGESKDWSNVLEHRWIRSKFITGWSAAEGGPGDSSHQRNDLVQTRLRRSCVMNQRGGPQDTEATDGHAAKAAHTLAVVDAERRAEFHRKKYMAEINDGLEKERVSNRIKQNFGWPFWEGGRNVKMKTPVDETEDQRAERERAEMMAQLHPRPKQPDEAREWHRTPFGQVMVMAAKGPCQENADCTCDFDASGGLKQKKDDCPVKQISHAEQEQHEHFHSWFGCVMKMFCIP